MASTLANEVAGPVPLHSLKRRLLALSTVQVAPQRSQPATPPTSTTEWLLGTLCSQQGMGDSQCRRCLAGNGG